MKVNLKYCTVAAILAAVLFSVTIGFLMNSGQASYTRSPEFWYWTTAGNSSNPPLYNVSSGVWTVDAYVPYAHEGNVLSTTANSTIFVPIYAVNPNPTLSVKRTLGSSSGELIISSLTDSVIISQSSLYSSTSSYNQILKISTNLSKGYSVLNVSVRSNGTQTAGILQAMWLE